MTATEVGEALEAAAAEVLETMFFTELLGDAAAPEKALAARVEFRGSPPGIFMVTVASPLARNLAASFLALDECEVAERQATEVVCEMANMLCGSVLSRLEPDAAFELLPPALVPPGECGGVSRAFDCGEGAVALWIDLRNNP